MEKSKLIQLLRSFSDLEYREFAKFIASPFFNQKEDLIQLYNILRKESSKEFIPKRISRELIMKKLYPKEPFSEKKYKYVTNLLLRQAERYISLKEMESQPLIQEYHLLNAYVKRDVDKNYNFIFNKTLKQHQLSTRKDSDFYYKDFLLNHVASEHFDRKKIRKNNEHSERLIHSLDLYYFANRLKYACHLMNNQKIISGNIKVKFTEEIIDFLNTENYNNYPAIFMYYNLYRLLTEENKQHFITIKDLLKEYCLFFKESELKELYHITINYCIVQYQKNNELHFLSDLYELYQNGIKSELLLENGFLSPWTYKNVIKTGFILKYLEETEKFIIENNEKLKEEFREDALQYNLAELYYHKKNFDKSIYYLNQVKFSDIYYALDSKFLLSKIYFETAEYEALESFIPSFQTYLRRNKLIAENVKQTYLNFTKMLIKILFEDASKNKLIQEIESTTPLTGKKWLLEQCT